MEENGILVVDDAPDICELFRIVLEDAGYSVLTAEDGQVALDLLQKCAYSGCLPRLVLLDLSMPVMSGEDLLVAIKADRRLSAIPVIAVTASTVPKPLKATALIRKPVEPDVLIRQIGRCLTLAAPRVHAQQ